MVPAVRRGRFITNMSGRPARAQGIRRWGAQTPTTVPRRAAELVGQVMADYHRGSTDTRFAAPSGSSLNARQQRSSETWQSIGYPATTDRTAHWSTLPQTPEAPAPRPRPADVLSVSVSPAPRPCIQRAEAEDDDEEQRDRPNSIHVSPASGMDRPPSRTQFTLHVSGCNRVGKNVHSSDRKLTESRHRVVTCRFPLGPPPARRRGRLFGPAAEVASSAIPPTAHAPFRLER